MIKKICIIIILLSGAVIFWNLKYEEKAPWKGYNVIIILIDALRFDHLGCYGYGKETSPSIDRIAASAAVFRNAISQASWTKPSVTSLFTSKYVDEHDVTLFSIAPLETCEFNILPESEVTLAETLSASGYATKAVINNDFIQKGFGLEQGFDEYTMVPGEEGQTAHALDWIKKNIDKRFFLYVHLIGPHAPYDPPDDIKRLFKDSYEGDMDFTEKHQEYFNTLDMSDEDIDELRARYDAKIRFGDGFVGQIARFLEENGLSDRTVLIITADHGEALGENGVIGHGFMLNTVVQVPLIVFPSKTGKRVEVESVVELVDIAPSLVTQMGLSLPPSFRGKNVFNIHPSRIKEKYGFSKSSEYFIIRSKDILFRKNLARPGEYYLKNIREDPYETSPPFTDIRLYNMFDSIYEGFRDEYREAGEKRPLDEDSVRRLRSLGYFQ